MLLLFLNTAIAELYGGNIVAIDLTSTSFLIFASSRFIYNSLPPTHNPTAPDVGKRRKKKSGQEVTKE